MVWPLYALQIFMASPSILYSFLILQTLGHSFSVICHPLQNGTSDPVNYCEVECLPQRAPASFPLHSHPLQQRTGEAFRTWAPSPWSHASMQCPIQPAGGTARGQWVCPSSSRHRFRKCLVHSFHLPCCGRCVTQPFRQDKERGGAASMRSVLGA